MKRKVPKYIVLLDWIKKQIESKQINYGDKFYSENELCDMFQISRQTVRQAIGMLEEENYLARKQGSGTYVIYKPGSTHTKTMTIGVISTYVDDYIFPAIIRGIERVLSKRNYSMQLVFTHNRVENETRALQMMMDKNVDGIIVEPTKSGLPNPNLPL